MLSSVRIAVLSALLLWAGDASAGGSHYNSAPYRAVPAPSNPAPPVIYSNAAPVSVTVSVAPPKPEVKPMVVSIRGPEGEVRKFPVEGGEAAIEVRQVILHAGQSVTIRWIAGK
jgi:hypothetical protein